MHIENQRPFDEDLFAAMRQGYIALFQEALSEHPHPNVNLVYRGRRARRVHHLCLDFLAVRHQINTMVRNGAPVPQATRDHLAELRHDVALYVETPHEDTRILTSTWTTEGDEPDACTCSAATSCICDSRSTTQWQMAKRSPRPTNSTSASFGTTLLFTSKTCMTIPTPQRQSRLSEETSAQSPSPLPGLPGCSAPDKYHGAKRRARPSSHSRPPRRVKARCGFVRGDSPRRLPHPNVNLDYRRRRARRVHVLCCNFLHLRQQINAAVANGQAVAQADQQHLAELRHDVAFYVENVHDDCLTLT
ncbi:uncharacterized protein LOC119396179 isoform X2 [Rhipicephalus sanguineus]|uniref:uncharacterized protein LOC119396179 isoform X1 n=1 Tax=Rhipicephalus sanguineus TaxID=34632 RepID=UPI001894CA09|nr:uncharacterized protein LOC119396179 isoform X1 [Rhipicephalus sanguineus]XP_049272939.1 uncharacterized protein LOC119396179 isoform X1 [Rhipicephalus sanguineus]XP_049272940.1 uncharacterized protein LOC119396179 isoform X2 [Rhipicephalus sanguineus]